MSRKNVKGAVELSNWALFLQIQDGIVQVWKGSRNDGELILTLSPDAAADIAEVLDSFVVLLRGRTR